MTQTVIRNNAEMTKMDDFEVFKSMENDLEEKYPHKVVAIHEGKVILIGDTYKEVMKKLREQGIKESFIHRLGPSEDAIAILYYGAKDEIQI